MNRKALDNLIQACKADSELLEIIQDALRSFEEYHTAIYSMEIRKQLLAGTVDALQYQEEIGEMDRRRTGSHNAVISNISLLNRLAEQQRFNRDHAAEIRAEKRQERIEEQKNSFKIVFMMMGGMMVLGLIGMFVMRSMP